VILKVVDVLKFDLNRTVRMKKVGIHEKHQIFDSFSRISKEQWIQTKQHIQLEMVWCKRDIKASYQSMEIFIGWGLKIAEKIHRVRKKKKTQWVTWMNGWISAKQWSTAMMSQAMIADLLKTTKKNPREVSSTR
jgi:hypothetical protein